MLPVLLVVFVAVFAILALLLVASSSSPSKQTRETLDSVIRTSRASKSEEVVDVRKSLLLSSIPWINYFLSKIKAAGEVRLTLEQAGLNWTPARLFLTSALCFAVTALVAHFRTGIWELAAVLGLAAAFLPYFYVLQRRTSRFRLIQQKLPEALDLMVSALRAGHSMTGALGAAAREAPEPVGRELRVCFEEQNYGIDLRTAIANLIERVPLSDIRIISTAMLIHKESGGNLADVLDKTGAVIRDRFRLLQQIRVHTAQGRLTGWILSVVPLVLGTVLYTMNPGYMRLLFERQAGHKMLAAAGGMNLLGLLIIRKIVNIRV